MSGLSLLVIRLCVASAKNCVATRRSSITSSSYSRCSQSLSTRTDSKRLGGAIWEPRPMMRDALLGCEEPIGEGSGGRPHYYCTYVSIRGQRGGSGGRCSGDAESAVSRRWTKMNGGRARRSESCGRLGVGGGANASGLRLDD